MIKCTIPENVTCYNKIGSETCGVCIHFYNENTVNEEIIVNHPIHYGGEGDLYEAIKVIDAWELNFNLGSVLKYIKRRIEKDTILENLKKAQWYLNHEIENLERKNG